MDLELGLFNRNYILMILYCFVFELYLKPIYVFRYTKQ